MNEQQKYCGANKSLKNPKQTHTQTKTKPMYSPRALLNAQTHATINVDANKIGFVLLRLPTQNSVSFSTHCVTNNHTVIDTVHLSGRRPNYMIVPTHQTYRSALNTRWMTACVPHFQILLTNFVTHFQTLLHVHTFKLSYGTHFPTHHKMTTKRSHRWKLLSKCIQRLICYKVQ